MTDPELLMAVLEVREELDDARTEEEVIAIRGRNQGSFSSHSFAPGTSTDGIVRFRGSKEDDRDSGAAIGQRESRPRRRKELGDPAAVPREHRWGVQGMESR